MAIVQVYISGIKWLRNLHQFNDNIVIRNGKMTMTVTTKMTMIMTLMINICFQSTNASVSSTKDYSSWSRNRNKILTETPLEMFYKKGVLKISQNLQENTCTRVSFLILWHSCFPVNFMKFLRISFLQCKFEQFVSVLKMLFKVYL